MICERDVPSNAAVSRLSCGKTTNGLWTMLMEQVLEYSILPRLAAKTSSNVENLEHDQPPGYSHHLCTSIIDSLGRNFFAICKTMPENVPQVESSRRPNQTTKKKHLCTLIDRQPRDYRACLLHVMKTLLQVLVLLADPSGGMGTSCSWKRSRRATRLQGFSDELSERDNTHLSQ